MVQLRRKGGSAACRTKGLTEVIAFLSYAHQSGCDRSAIGIIITLTLNIGPTGLNNGAAYVPPASAKR